MIQYKAGELYSLRYKNPFINQVPMIVKCVDPIFKLVNIWVVLEVLISNDDSHPRGSQLFLLNDVFDDPDSKFVVTKL